MRHVLRTGPDSAGHHLHACCQWEVIYIEIGSASLIVAIVTASIAFASLVLKIIEVARKK
jgi:hypothetical protein